MEKLYKTKDLAFAGVLLTLGIKLNSTRKESDICWFLFNNRNLCEELYRKYYFDDLAINARKYQDNLKLLKILIYS